MKYLLIAIVAGLVIFSCDQLKDEKSDSQNGDLTLYNASGEVDSCEVESVVCKKAFDSEFTEACYARGHEIKYCSTCPSGDDEMRCTGDVTADIGTDGNTDDGESDAPDTCFLECDNPETFDPDTCSCDKGNQECGDILDAAVAERNKMQACESDSDCGYVQDFACPIGGCGMVGNINYDISTLVELAADFTASCSTCVNGCAGVTTPVVTCEENVCRIMDAASFAAPEGTPEVCTKEENVPHPNQQEYTDQNCQELALACNDDDECTGVPSGCGNIVGVNKGFAAAAAAIYKTQGMAMDCFQYPGKALSFTSSCEASKCVVSDVVYNKE